MNAKENLLMEIKYMAEEMTELESEIRRGIEVIDEKKRLESKIENYMVSYLRLGGNENVKR